MPFQIKPLKGKNDTSELIGGGHGFPLELPHTEIDYA